MESIANDAHGHPWRHVHLDIGCKLFHGRGMGVEDGEDALVCAHFKLFLCFCVFFFKKEGRPATTRVPGRETFCHRGGFARRSSV